MLSASPRDDLEFLRGMFLVSAILIPLFGLLNWSHPYDPFAPRVAFSVIALALVIGTYYVSALREHIRLIGVVFCGALFGWFTYLAYRHNMTMEDVIGVLPIVGGAAVLFRQFWELVACIGFIAADLALAYAQADTPELSIGIFFAVIATCMLMLGSMSVWRVHLVEALRVANDTLRQHKRDLEERNLSLAETLESLRRTQTQLVQSEKMASLGLLVAGIAHEIKNPLNFVNNFSELSREFIADIKERQASGVALEQGEIEATLDDVAENLARIREHGLRADAIINSMMMHARERRGAPEVADFNSMFIEHITLAYAGFRTRDHGFTMELGQSLDPSAGRATISYQGLARVIVNLVSNACYAMRERTRRDARAPTPTLHVTTRRIDTAVEFTIADNGGGVPREIQPRIFDPFFTTKPPGEGTGLGLSMSYEIVVKELGGSIRFESSEGDGTTFFVHIPAPSASDT